MHAETVPRITRTGMTMQHNPYLLRIPEVVAMRSPVSTERPRVEIGYPSEAIRAAVDNFYGCASLRCLPLSSMVSVWLCPVLRKTRDAGALTKPNKSLHKVLSMIWCTRNLPRVITRAGFVSQGLLSRASYLSRAAGLQSEVSAQSGKHLLQDGGTASSRDSVRSSFPWHSSE